MEEPNGQGAGKDRVPVNTRPLLCRTATEAPVRVLVVLYHVGDALARAMERAGVGDLDIEVWCTDWEDAVTGCSTRKGLGWLIYADSLTRLIYRYRTAMSDAARVSDVR
jgi:hypothetical protein